MGRTIPSLRQLLEIERLEWSNFKKALPTKKRGRTLKIISVEKSVKKLTKPIERTLRMPFGLSCGFEKSFGIKCLTLMDNTMHMVL